MWKQAQIGLLGCCTLLLAAPLAAATLLRDAALTAPAADGARLVLDLSATPAAPKVFTLSNPERLVIDLPRTALAKGVKLPAPAGPVRGVRDGKQSGGTLRLVLELEQPMPYQRRIEGRKLIVDMGRVPATATPPVATPPPNAAASAASATSASPAPAASKAMRARHAPEDAGRDIIVAIDAGHGGTDPGASGRGGTREKDVVLAIAKALARRVDAEPGMRAYLTRSDDRFIELRHRIVLASRARADIFVSVHADAIARSDVSGSSVYVLSGRGASSEAARLLAKQENAADLKGGVSLSDKDGALASVLMDLAQSASIGVSGEAAERVLTQLDRVGTVRRTQVQNAGFAVLKLPDTPSMLVETAFISNPGEEKKLRTPEHQQAVAEAIFNGVRDHFRLSPPDGTLFARQRDQQRMVSSAGGSP